MEKVSSIDQAYELLKDGEILISSNALIVFMKQENLYIRSSNWNAKVTLEDFKELFDGHPFWIYEKKEEDISSQKDEEYYRWRNRYL